MKNIKYKRRRRSKIGLRILQITCGITFFLPFGWIGITEQGGSLAWTWAALGSMVLSAILLLICNRIEQKKLPVSVAPEYKQQPLQSSLL